MSFALIQESAKEVRRLSIAGSTLAVGDFRIKKLIAPLEQAGAQVPVFAQVAKAIAELVNGKEAESATRLLALSTLLNAILYTQGQTGTDGSFGDLELCATRRFSTRTSARALKPLITALTNAGAGRFEIVRSACERGAFNDLRLIDPAIQALGDNYPELAELVAEKILPGYGPGIVPRLKMGFELKGKKSDARRLKVMHRLDPAGTLDLCKTALEDGTAEVKAAAIECLAQHEACLPLVLEQAKSKNKTLRATALEVLAEHDRPEIVTLFTELIKGKALDLLARAFRAVRNRQVLRSLLDEGKRVFEAMLQDNGQPNETLQRYSEILDCLEQRKDAETEEFLLACFNQCGTKAAKKSATVGVDVAGRLASLLYRIGSARAFAAVLEKRELLPLSAFNVVFRSALRSWSPEKVYEEFAPLLEKQKGSGKQKGEVIEHTLWAAREGDPLAFYEIGQPETNSEEAEALRKAAWDPRWLDAGIKADALVFVCCLARPGHPGTVSYLLKLLETNKRAEVGMIIQGLARCQYPKLADVFMEQVAKRTKNAQYLSYDLQLLFQSARHLVPADLPRLDAFAAKLDEKFLDHYLIALEPLRPAKKATETA
jgi:hypothetical protein